MRHISIAILVLMFNSACSKHYLPTLLDAHRIEIQQGNALLEKDVSRLQPGMTKAQVIYILGTPLILDHFHQQRWDYIYYLQTSKNKRELRRLLVYFDHEVVSHIDNQTNG